MQPKKRYIINDRTGKMQLAPESQEYFLWFCGIGIFVIGILIGRLSAIMQTIEASAIMR